MMDKIRFKKSEPEIPDWVSATDAANIRRIYSSAHWFKGDSQNFTFFIWTMRGGKQLTSQELRNHPKFR